MLSREQRRAYDRVWYAAQSESWKVRKRKLQNERRDTLRQVLADFKNGKVCPCGEGDPVCLDFHHLSDDKEISLADVVRNGWSIPRIMREIAKCELICANCHRKKHAKEDLVA